MSTPIQHTKECFAAHDAWERATAEYVAKWPRYCRTCNGWGGHYDQYDPSPAGVGLAAGYMYDFEPCPHCVEIGICPKCGMKRFNEEDENFNYELFDVKCPVCGWKIESSDGIMKEPECFCQFANEPLEGLFDE